MHLQKSSRYGLYALICMARRPSACVTSTMVAKEFLVSETHVAKVLQQLAKAGFIQGVRGPAGGYRLAKDPRELTMFDVVRVLEGPDTPSCFACAATGSGDHEQCATYETCPIRQVMEEIAAQIYYTLRSVSLASLIRTET